MFGLPATRSSKIGVTDTFTTGVTSIAVPTRIRRITQLVLVGAGGPSGDDGAGGNSQATGGGGGETKIFSGSMAVSPGQALSCVIGYSSFTPSNEHTSITINGTTYEAKGGQQGTPTTGGDGGYGGAGGVVSAIGTRGVGGTDPIEATSSTPTTSGSWTSYPGGGGGCVPAAVSPTGDGGAGYAAGGGRLYDPPYEWMGGGGGGYNASYGRGGRGSEVVGGLECGGYPGVIMITWGA